MNPKIVRELVELSKVNHGYDYHTKEAFHRKGRTVMKYVAEALGLKKGDFEIFSCKGGPAVGGEVCLHADNIFIQFGEDWSHTGGVLYRRCRDRKDCTGTNCWMQYETLLDFDAAVSRFKSVLNTEWAAPRYVPADLEFEAA